MNSINAFLSLQIRVGWWEFLTFDEYSFDLPYQEFDIICTAFKPRLVQNNLLNLFVSIVNSQSLLVVKNLLKCWY